MSNQKRKKFEDSLRKVGESLNSSDPQVTAAHAIPIAASARAVKAAIAEDRERNIDRITGRKRRG